MTPNDTAADEVLVEKSDGVGIVSLNRPQVRNAVHPAMGYALQTAFRDLEASPEISAIVLTGCGGAFCAGADISRDVGDAGAVLHDIWNPLITTMVELNVPIIAALDGVAAGAGASLAFACDLRIASAAARFQLSFVKIGLAPDAGATWLLPRIVGLGRASELALLGGDLSAPEAYQWGLINRLVEDGSALNVAIDLASRFHELPSSVGAIKALHRAGQEEQLVEHLNNEARVQARLQHHPDFAEAVNAFRAKRAPRFASRQVPPGIGSRL